MKKASLAIGIVLGAAAVSNAAPVYFAGTGHYYDFISGTPSWTDAAAAAAASTYLGANGYLATVTSADENAFLQTTFGSQNLNGWIGLLQSVGANEPADGWGWITGEAYVYTNWSGSEPNDAGGESYAQMYTNGTWNDLANDSLNGRNGYYVEYEAVPEPASMAVLGMGALAFLRRRRNAR